MTAEAVVYFVQMGEDGPIKIGTTTTLAQRLSSLQGGSPHPLRLLGTVAGDRTIEAEWHLRFRHLRQQGEWFTPDGALQVAIMAAVQPPPIVADASASRSTTSALVGLVTAALRQHANEDIAFAAMLRERAANKHLLAQYIDTLQCRSDYIPSPIPLRPRRGRPAKVRLAETQDAPIGLRPTIHGDDLESYADADDTYSDILETHADRLRTLADDLERADRDAPRKAVI